MSPFSRRWYRAMTKACVLVPAMAQAELTVIYDSGDTQSIVPLLEVFESADGNPDHRSVPTAPKLGLADPHTWLPIRSPGLTPGAVQARSQERPFARPFFLIGSDIRSRQWLEAHRDRLKAIGAVGMLVQADTLDDLHTIATLAEGLSILPASASDIAQALGISQYPVLISAQSIEQ